MAHVKITIIYDDEQVGGEGAPWSARASMNEAGTNVFLNIERWGDDLVSEAEGGPLYGWTPPSSRREIDFALASTKGAHHQGITRGQLDLALHLNPLLHLKSTS